MNSSTVGFVNLVFDLVFELAGVAYPPGLTFEFDLLGLGESPGSSLNGVALIEGNITSPVS